MKNGHIVVSIVIKIVGGILNKGVCIRLEMNKKLNCMEVCDLHQSQESGDSRGGSLKYIKDSD